MITWLRCQPPRLPRLRSASVTRGQPFGAAHFGHAWPRLLAWYRPLRPRSSLRQADIARGSATPPQDFDFRLRSCFGIRNWRGVSIDPRTGDSRCSSCCRSSLLPRIERFHGDPNRLFPSPGRAHPVRCPIVPRSGRAQGMTSPLFPRPIRGLEWRRTDAPGIRLSVTVTTHTCSPEPRRGTGDNAHLFLASTSPSR